MSLSALNSVWELPLHRTDLCCHLTQDKILTYYICMACLLYGGRVRLFFGPAEAPGWAAVGHK